MTRATLPHPVIDNPVHLYRALLRECTYLPDPAARVAVARHVSSRFHEHHPLPPRPGYRALPPKGKVDALAKARRALSVLVRANHGERFSLNKVLLFAYARRGRPRRELVRRLQLSEAVLDNGVKKLPSRRVVPAPRNIENWPPLPSKIKALFQSQRRHIAIPDRKQVSPNVKIGLNRWGRRMPKVREKNMRWDKYGEILESLLPPLPEHEWRRLRDLVHGTKRWDGPVPRRPGSRLLLNQESTLLTPTFLKAPLVKKEHHQIVFKEPPQSLNVRAMRRLWARVFYQCPYMWWDAEQGAWQVEWGASFMPNQGLKKPSAKIQMYLFGGVDQQGKVIPSPSEGSANGEQKDWKNFDRAKPRESLRPS